MKIFIFVICAISGSLAAVDYCNPDLCQFYTGKGYETRKHIACPGVAVNECPAKANPLKIDDKVKAVIVDLHNAQRNAFFSKKAVWKLFNNEDLNVRDFAPPAAMPEMVWSDELAAIAEKNAMQCTFDHDECRNTENFPYAGQAIGRAYGSKFSDPVECAKKLVPRWAGEIESPVVTQEFFDSYQKRSIKVNAAAQVLADRSKYVGCAGVNYSNEFTYLVCNYGFNLIVGEPVYKKGKVAASDCKTGKSAKWPNLCSAKEEVKALPYASTRSAIVAEFDDEE